MQAHLKEVSLAKIVIITLLIKSFPLLLPSHNCIIMKNNVQFSRCIFVEINATLFGFQQAKNLSCVIVSPLQSKPARAGLLIG